jgi:hypothetical protein
MDVLIAEHMNFSAQPLHVSQGESAARATLLGVPTIAEVPNVTDTVVVYLDVWERLVTPVEEDRLVHSALGVESCARLKREWVVRVRIGNSVPAPGDADFIAGHSYYALATIAHQTDVPITSGAITDQREQRLLVPPATLIEDLFGPVDYRRGQGRPLVNFREVINALLRSELPMTPELLITTSAAFKTDTIFLKDSYEDIWAFWRSTESGNDDIWYKRYSRASDSWGNDTPLTTDSAGDYEPFALEDQDGTIWVFWVSQRSGNYDIRYRKMFLAI